MIDMSLVTNIPKSAIVLPSNVRVQQAGTTLILQKVKRRVKRFKMSKKQRDKIAASARKFKWPILTSIAVGPGFLLAAQQAMTKTGLMNQLQSFAVNMLSFYTGVIVPTTIGAPVRFMPERLAIGWGPVLAVGAAKVLARGRIMAINRALSRAQIPANLS